MAVGGNEEERHGIILAKSELAKRAGVTTGMPLWEARQKCKDIIIVPPHFEYYSKFSKLLHEIYEDYTDYVEPFGLDECWLDVTDCGEDGYVIAEEIRNRVKNELGLTVSIGVSFNKVFAKLGSDLKKPDAVTVISRENFQNLIWKLPASDLLYCGRQTSKALSSVGVETIGQLANSNKKYLINHFGKNGEMLWLFANGLDTSRVAHKDHYEPPKSIGHGVTCVENLDNFDEAKKVIYTLSLDIGYRLRKEGLYARGVSLGVKNEHFSHSSYQLKLEIATQDESKIAKSACELLDKNYSWFYKIRALTVTVNHLESSETAFQQDMFYDYSKDEKQRKLCSAIDSIKDTFGKGAILPATVLDEKKMPHKKQEDTVLPGMMHK